MAAPSFLRENNIPFPSGRGWHAEKRLCAFARAAGGRGARVTLSGQSAALVEGQHGVIELTESRVRLRTGRGVLTVQGEGLRLRALSVDAALIEGHVLTATYAGGGRTP